MTDTLWADISEFQQPADNSYPYQILSFRANDGTYHDKKFSANYAWAKQAYTARKISGFIVYYYWRRAGTGASTLKSIIGTPPPGMCVMMDVESGDGNGTGNASSQLNSEYEELGKWLGNPHRVIAYGNTSDLNSIWPDKPAGIQLVIAAYGTNPAYPGKFAHQYTDAGKCEPFGTCDMNSADGLTLAQTLTHLGLSGAPVSPMAAAPPSVTTVPALHVDYFGIGHNATCPDVRTWQQQMKNRTWSITADGDYGPASEAVCKTFQAQKNLATDGQVGPQTWAAAWKDPITT